MKAKQLELFDKEPMSTKITKVDNWFLIDNNSQRNYQESYIKRLHYPLVVSTNGMVYTSGNSETRILTQDEKGKKINMFEYLTVGQIIKHNGLVLYNKKLGKTVSKTVNNRVIPKVK